MGPEAERKKGIFDDLRAMLADQTELARLEWRYESAQAARRGLALVAAALLLASAVGILEAVTLHLFVKAGLSWLAAASTLGVLDLIGAGALWRFAGRRDPRAGQPFEGSRREALETVAWIRKLFS